MNRSIRSTALFALLLIVVLLAAVTNVQAFHEDDYAKHPYNQRNFLEIKSIPRGQISAGEAILAESHEGANGFFERSYPDFPVSFGHITGYLSDQYGAAGIESSKNDVLSGKSVSTGQWLAQLFGGENRGNNVQLTLVPEIQEVAYSQLANNGYSGSVVALRPSTGEVLAMASTPSFDPNAIVNPDTAEAAWETLNSDPGNPLLNHAAQETLPPGSIFKIITTAAGLSAGYGPGSSLTGAAEITLPNTQQTLTNYAGNPCTDGSNVTLQTAFALSCNTAFVQMGIDVGAEKIAEKAAAFGVGETYDLALPMAPGGLGDIPDQAALGQSAIGQRDVTMSALQAAVMAATVANGGERMEPHIVSTITAPNLTTISKTKPKSLGAAVSPEEAQTLTQLMLASEANTQGVAGSAGDIASKTGTAEHGDAGSAPHTWYVAFAPSTDADIAVAVVVKDGGGQGTTATGGRVAAPIGHAVINAARAAGLGREEGSS